MRCALLVGLLLVALTDAFWNDYMPTQMLRTHETLTSIEDNRRLCKAVSTEIQNILLLQRATDDPSEYWAMEQRFMELIKTEDKLKKDIYDLTKKVTSI